MTEDNNHKIRFKYLIRIFPLGMLYGSAGAFLSPENLVGRSGSKFPPEASTLAGLFFSVNKQTKKYPEEQLSDELYVAGGFWGERNYERTVYVPIPRIYIIQDKDNFDRWYLNQDNGELTWYRIKDEKKEDLKAEFHWFPLRRWNQSLQMISRNAKAPPWQYNPILHPYLQDNQRCTRGDDALFLENAVQMDDDYCLVYLSTHELKSGWYKFGGENHLVEIESVKIKDNWSEFEIFEQHIKANQGMALITPAVWGSNRFSCRYPKDKDNNKVRDSDQFSCQYPQAWGKTRMLTDRPIPYRYSAGGRLGRGRYAVPVGSVYVPEKELKPWYEWDFDLFPKPALKHLGCGLALPLDLDKN